MRTRTHLTTVLLAAAALMMPFQASALSVRQFENKTRDQQTEFVFKAVGKIVSDVATVNPGLSKAIHDYFEVTPRGKEEPPGLLAFAAELGAVENLADKGKLDLGQSADRGNTARYHQDRSDAEGPAAGQEEIAGRAYTGTTTWFIV
ncbi:MAG TPA: hypothetical protein VEV17_09060 [Bryobacteraceae bacterium]|nr:hypothetical protein [Bryobacteraceae bacterium]